MGNRAPVSAPDARLPKALSHPVRAQALTILNEQVASPNEIAEMLGVGLEDVSYHVRRLRDLGCVELVCTARRRGATEHYYRAVDGLSRVVARFNDGGKLQGTFRPDGTVQVDAPTPSGD